MDTIFYKPSEVAEKLKITKQTVLTYIAKKKLDSIKLDYNTVRIPASALHRFIESKKQ
jgi:excisionase family DNA binding protein